MSSVQKINRDLSDHLVSWESSNRIFMVERNASGLPVRVFIRGADFGADLAWFNYVNGNLASFGNPGKIPAVFFNELTDEAYRREPGGGGGGTSLTLAEQQAIAALVNGEAQAIDQAAREAAAFAAETAQNKADGNHSHAAAVLGGPSGFMTGAEKQKLFEIASGATANATDAQLRDRSTHTGTQAISSVTGLQTALDNKLDDSQATATGLAVLGAATQAAGRTALGLGTAATAASTDFAPAAHVGAGAAAHANVVAGGAAGFMSGADKTKLDGVAAGATANATDDYLLNRANQTGEQAMSTVTGLATALENKVETSLLTPITATKAEPVDLDTIPLRNSENANTPVWVTKAAFLAEVTSQLATLQAAVEALQQGGGGAVAPSAFVAGNWTLTAAGTSGTANLNVLDLPTNGGSAITALEYRIGTGAAVALSGTGTGARSITGLTDGLATSFQIRAVNAIGAGPWSDTKSVTTSAGGGGAVTWTAVARSNETDPLQLSGTGINPAHPAGAAGSGLLVAVLDHVGQAAATAGISPPAGWTLVASVFNQAGFTDQGGALGSQVYVAPGDTAPGTWTGTLPAGGEGYCAPRFAIHYIEGASSVRDFQTINETAFGLGDDTMPGPSVVAAAGDMILSHLYLAQIEDAAISAPAASYTRVVEALTLARRSTVVRNNAPAGATGTIAHGISGGAWTARVGITLAVRSA